MAEVIGPILSFAITSLSNCYKAAETIIERLALLKSNERHKDEVIRKARFVISLITDLRSFITNNADELTQSMIPRLKDLTKQMEMCQEYCCKPSLETKIKPIDSVLNFLTANERKEVLQNLEKGLSSVIDMINLMLNVENFMRKRGGKATGLPGTPTSLCARATGIDEMSITVTYPEEECNGTPVTRCIVELFNMDDDNCTGWIQFIWKMHEGVYAPKELRGTINRLQVYCTYKIRARFYTDNGPSPNSKCITCKTLEPVPGPPTEFCFSSYRTANMIKLRWNRPDMYSRFVHHYEIEFSEKSIFWGHEWKPAGETRRFSYRINDLSQDTRYYFRVRSVTANCQKSVWTHEIDETTRFSNLSKAALTPLVFLGATIGAPVLGAIFGAGVSVEDEKEVSTKTVAKGIAGGVGGTLAGTLGAPVVGGAAAHLLIHEGDEYSTQSDED